MAIYTNPTTKKTIDNSLYGVTPQDLANQGYVPDKITANSLVDQTPIDYVTAEETPIPGIPEPTTSETKPTLSQPQSDLQSKINELMGVNNSLAGEGAYRSNLEQQNKDLQEQMKAESDYTAQLKLLQAEQKNIPDQMQLQAEGRGITAGGLQPLQTAELRRNAIKANTVGALLSASQGKIAYAQGLIDRAVKAEFDPIRAKQQALKDNIDLALKSPLYTEDEKKRAEETKRRLDAEDRVIAQQEADKKTILSLATEASQNGAGSLLSTQIAQAKTVDEAIALSAGFTQQKTQQDEQKQLVINGYTKLNPSQLKGLTESQILRMPNGDIYKKPADKLSTQLIVSNNRNILIDTQTGKTIADLGQAENKFQLSSDAEGNPLVFNPQTGSVMRTDRNNNPTAMTTDVAKSLGLVEGIDYIQGDPFQSGNGTLYTAKFIGDPVQTTIKGLDNAARTGKGAFYTQSGQQRWTHTAMSDQEWLSKTPQQKQDIVAQMYSKEGGSGNLIKKGEPVIMKVNGIDYQVASDGSLKTPDVPAETQKATELKTNALTSAQELLNKLNSGQGSSAVGFGNKAVRYFTGLIGGTSIQDFETQFNNLKSLLSLDNVKYLKGQGQVSDAERKLLSDASAKLDLNQSATEFKKSLEDVIKGLNGTEKTTQSVITVISPDGEEGTIPADQLEEALKQGYKKK